jgi:outer membrane protein
MFQRRFVARDRENCVVSTLKSHLTRGVVAAAAALAAVFALPSGAADATDVKVGAIGFVAPKYEGSDEYRVLGAPFAYPIFSDAATGGLAGRVAPGNGIDDLRLRLLDGHGFEAGVLGGYAFGRDEDDGPLLDRLGDVDGGVILGAYAGFRAGIALFDVSYHRIVSGDTSGYFRLGATVENRVAPNLNLRVRVGTTYADDDYMQDYFGVTVAQAAVSGAMLPAYDADAGFKDVFVDIGATYDIDSRWSLLAGVGYKRLIGDAADSPVIETEDLFSGRLGLTYRFSLNR